jgi:adenylate kinase
MDQQTKIEMIKNWLGSGSINIFGLAFSGKDTVGKRLAADLGAEFLSSGDIVRAARKNAANEEIRRATKMGDSGVWVPTDEFKELITPYLYDEKLAGKALILSMVGRWIGEEQTVLSALKKGHHDTKAVLLLNVPEDEIWQRWELANDPNSRNLGRVDDADRGRVAGRLNEFRDKTLPVIEIYRQMGLLLEINGQQSREAVYDETVNKLYKFTKGN